MLNLKMPVQMIRNYLPLLCAYSLQTTSTSVSRMTWCCISKIIHPCFWQESAGAYCFIHHYGHTSYFILFIHTDYLQAA
jgi:hypothetical protein